MDVRAYFIGLDIGTSGLKALALAPDGRVLAQSHREYAPRLLPPGGAEQDADTWWLAAQAALREIAARAGPGATGIGLSGQMHSTVTLDAALRPVRPALLWLDSRAAPEAAALRARLGDDRLAAWTGNPLMPGFTLASLLWLAAHEPDSWARTRHVLLAKDYVRLRLTGELATDFSDASATAMLDVQARRWCAPLLDAANIPAAWLPEPLESGEAAGRLLPAVARAAGLPPGIPVACGAGDQEAQALGNAIVRPGLLSSTIGTGGQLFAPLAEYAHDPRLRLHVFCHAVPRLWHWEAAILTAGRALQWLRDAVLGGRYSYQELADAAAAVEPGAGGLFFLPYLAGERTPHMDPYARGAFHGLALEHGWPHLARAVMEGVVFALADGLALMRALGARPERVVASGGGVRHPLWLQLQADIFGLEVVRAESPEAAAYGAALLGGMAAGAWPGAAAACAATVRWSDDAVRPQPARVARYRELWDAYRALYPGAVPAPGASPATAAG